MFSRAGLGVGGGCCVRGGSGTRGGTLVVVVGLWVGIWVCIWVGLWVSLCVEGTGDLLDEVLADTDVLGRYVIRGGAETLDVGYPELATCAGHIEFLGEPV